MTVCFDLSAAAHERGGLGRYAANIAAGLLGLGVHLSAFINDPRESHLRPPLSDLPTFSAHLPRKRWRLRAAVSYFGGPTLGAAFPGVTLFHATEHLLPVIPGAHSVFTLHDVAYLRYPRYHLLQNRAYLTLMMPRFLKRAEAVICVSEATRRDAEQFYGLPPEKLHVVPEGVEPHFRPATPTAQAEVRARYHLPERFVLYVGTIEPRKNLLTLLEAWPHLPAEVTLVLAGGKGWLYEETLARATALGQRVRVLGHVPEADLPALLSAATVFAFPSVFEGFGLPPLEALACGTPVVAAEASSLPEVVGTAGLLVPPLDVAAWGAALRRVLEDATLRADLSARGRTRAAQFTWEKAARATWQVYRAVYPGLPAL